MVLEPVLDLALRPHGFGHGRKGVQQKIAQAHAGVSVNDLTDDTLIDQLSGNAAVNGVPVQLEAIAPEVVDLETTDSNTGATTAA